MLNNLIRFFLVNKLVTIILLVLFIVWGLVTAPFNWKAEWFPRDPVAVDAIPDIGENQQIVFTEWKGRSPQDIEDQITYPLTTTLLGIPGIKTVRSSSMFGFSVIYIIFEEEIEFYWSRSRILEKLNSLPSGLLPEEVQPTLGPDATGLGQIFWYTLEGRDPDGNVVGGWSLQELRSIQDFYIKYGLFGAEGVAEVASVGGYVKEYQVDVDPVKMKAANVSLKDIVQAVRSSNLDIGAKTIEINRVEYFVRGLGYIKNVKDLENAVVKTNKHVPIYVKDVARVSLGPATRRGVLDKSGAEVVGAVVVARYGSNPLAVIDNVKEKIAELAPGLPEKILDDGTVSKVTIVPFYDRTELIYETLGTLEEALSLEIIITIIVVIIMVLNLRASLLISSILPLGVLMVFIAMRYFGVDANIVALSGIAIAIGTMVDLGVILTENILRHFRLSGSKESKLEVIYRATTEVAPAIITAVSTTLISFLPVFTLEAAEGKLFRPLAFTKTFAIFAALIITIIFIPALAHWLFSIKFNRKRSLYLLNGAIAVAGIVILFFHFWTGFLLLLIGLAGFIPLSRPYLPEKYRPHIYLIQIFAYAAIVTLLLAKEWLPLGVQNPLVINFLFVALILGLVLGFFYLMIKFYEPILRWCLRHKLVFLAFPLALIISAIFIWRSTGSEFMPSLDEGSFLLMPSSMAHAGMEENIEMLKKLDMAVTAIPEVKNVVGKLGRVESPLDPAPIGMFENVINYKSEYITDENGNKLRFETDEEGNFIRDENGDLVEDKNGEYFRQWRDHIRSPQDIWNEIGKATQFPGITAAPKLQPIETRLVMLQTGMRAPIGIKIKGPDLETIEKFGMDVEKHLKEVPGVKESTVFADRIVGKPYIEIELHRKEIARFGLNVEDVQHAISAAVGGMPLTTTVEGRERYPVRVRYPRELRDSPERLKQILIPTKAGAQIPLGQLVEIKYVQGPQVIKSEDGFLVGYVIFDKEAAFSEVEVVENAQEYLQDKIARGHLTVPAGISYRFSGSYENQLRAAKRLSIVIPIVLMIIFLILYFQFRSVPVSLMIFSGIAVAFSGGFLLIWLYAQPGFLDFSLLGTNMRTLFQVNPINLSVAVWVGFIALFGIATDDGVLIATYIRDLLKERKMDSIEDIKETIVEAGKKRVTPATMTTATTVLALLPILTSSGRGADIMIPMAIPIAGGMVVQSITMFVVPVLYTFMEERKLRRKTKADDV